MEIGRIPEIDNSQRQHIDKLEKVKEVDNENRIVPDEKYKNASSKDQPEDVNEVILDNVQFGYNKESHDFYVKVTRGEAEYKFPTEDMMKMKAFLMETLEQDNK